MKKYALLAKKLNYLPELYSNFDIAYKHFQVRSDFCKNLLFPHIKMSHLFYVSDTVIGYISSTVRNIDLLFHEETPIRAQNRNPVIGYIYNTVRDIEMLYHSGV